VGILFQTIVGAVLYEFVTNCGPFDYFSATCLVVLIVTLVVYRRSKVESVHSDVQDSLV
jgi:transcriptional antiterminator Rof (Rho-off)